MEASEVAQTDAEQAAADTVEQGIDAPEDAPQSRFVANPTVPIRSRKFTREDARVVLAMLTGKAEGLEKPAERVSFGEFKTAGAARSAGVTLNRLLQNEGAEHKYAVSTYALGAEKFLGVMLNRKAKDPPKRADSGSGSGSGARRRRAA